MIKNIIFDLGNVLLRYHPTAYLESLNYQGEIKNKLKKEIFDSKEWIMLDRGIISQKKAVAKWQQRSPEFAEEIKKVMAEWEKMLTPKKDTLKILRSLAEENFELYILSNFHQKAYQYIKNNYDFLNYFSAQVISAQIKMVKPEAEIYQYLLNKFNLKPEASLFIDDTKENIKGALKEGIRVIHFKNSAALKKELKLYLKE